MLAKFLSPSPGKFSPLAYSLILLNTVALKYYELTDKPAFIRLTAEDFLIETLTAILVFSAGILLLVTGRMERKTLRRSIYVVGGVVLLLIAGEEISWGQRIFGYPTPDWMIEINAQTEFNLHNLLIFEQVLDLVLKYGVQLLCMMACVAFFTGREKIRGIPVPSILLTLGLLATHSYLNDYLRPEFIMITLRVLFTSQNTLICLIIIFALFARQYELLIFSAAAILLALALEVVNHLEIFLLVEPNARNEVFEYLMTLGIFCYSLELLLNQRPSIQADRLGSAVKPDQGRESIGPFFRRFSPRRTMIFARSDTHPSGNFGRLLHLAPPGLLIAMSVGLMVLSYVDFRSKQTYAQSLDQEMASREPIIRSRFNVYLSQNRIIYYKEHCSQSAVAPPFFLYVIPTDPHESLIIRRFTFLEYGGALYRNASYKDGLGRRIANVCFLAQPLPRWEIAYIGTGQESRWEAIVPAYRQAHDVDVQADRSERDADRAIPSAHRLIYDAVKSREPRVRSDFDVYLHDRTLIFVKEPCMRTDVEAVFFLHVVPVDKASLPSYRQEYGFGNLDFRFFDFGRVFDDKCLAFVPLPSYNMSRIRTGQYLSEKRLWGVEFPFHIGESPASPGA